MRSLRKTGGRLGLTVLLAACAINPATGEREISLIGEEQEIAMGREADPQVTAQMGGEYDDPALQAWVTGLGQDLAAESERPDLPWTFRVLDDDLINAFALPGGYIYLTRGILSHMASEAEVAAVLGHEIGHVTARHAARQITRQQLGTLGLGIGMILSETVRDYGGAAAAGLQILSLKHSRDDEREADALGFRYMTREGYAPGALTDVMRMLESTGPGGDASPVPSWLTTHPDPGDRAADNEERIADAGVDFSAYRSGRADLLDHLDGVVFGPDPRQGYFIDSRFLHPTLEFEVTFPSGWGTANLPMAVQAVEEGGAAGMLVTLAEDATAAAAVQEFLAADNVEPTRVWVGTVGALPARWASFDAETRSGLQRGVVAFVEYGGSVYRLLGLAGADDWSRVEPTVLAAIGSFAPLTDTRLTSVRPHRINVVTLPNGMTGADFLRRYPPSVTEAEALLANRLDPDDWIGAGERLKWITGGSIPGGGT